MTNSMMSKTLMAAAAVALTTVSFASSVSAQTQITRTAAVQYADLDLKSDAGRSTLQARIKGAVRKVCGSYNARDIAAAQDYRNCRDQANLSANRASVTITATAGTPIETAMVINN